jgi:hypothetical protein
MAIAAKPSLPFGPPSAADWAAISIAAALETRVTTAAVIASTAIAIAIAGGVCCQVHGARPRADGCLCFICVSQNWRLAAIAEWVLQ